MDRQVRELRILNTIAEALNRGDDLTKVLAQVAELLGLKTGWIWLTDPETGQFYNAAVLNLPPYLQEPVRMTGSRCWCIDAFRDGELTPKNVDIMECSRLRKGRRAALTSGLACHASIPLYFQDKPLGIMNVTGPSWRQLDEHELHLLSIVAYQVGIALERSRLAEEATRFARTEERAALARDLHDTLAQGLTAIVLHVESALKALPDKPEKARARLQVALETARSSLEDARQSVLTLRAGVLKGQPLAEAVLGLTRRFTSQTGVRVQLHTQGLPPLPLRTETELYHVVTEALSNVERHAGAHEVRVDLTADDVVRVRVADDGRGFETRRPRPQSHGLVGMRERVRLLGGKIRISSRPGAGTRISIQVPR